MAGYYSPEFFCDRETETSAILGALHNGRNVTLIQRQISCNIQNDKKLYVNANIYSI